MKKVNPKIHVLNILIAVIFIFGFYIGTVSLPIPREKLWSLSANAAMASDAERSSPLGGFSSLVSDVIPSVSSHSRAETHVAKEPSPTPESREYKTDTPVYKGGSGDTLKIINDSGYAVNTNELLAEPVSPIGGGIQVLLLHTHTSEAYTPTENYDYAQSDAYRTTDPERNIVSVGKVVERVLTQHGIGVIHDTTSHDSPSYSGSYRRALDTVQRNLELHPGITLVVDIHRDAIQNENGEYMKTEAVINEESCAQISILIGTDAGGLEHSFWRENLKYGLKLQKIACEKYPSLARDLHLREERFNGHASKGAMIIEIGSNGNTLEEAQKSAEYVGECIAQMIAQM